MRFQQKLRYEHPGLGDDLSPDPFASRKMTIAKHVGDLLQKHYCGHAWHAEVVMDRRGGMVKVRLNGIMPANRWYAINFRHSETLHSLEKAVVKAGGELLERYGIRRGNFNLDDWRNALAAMPSFARMTGRGHVAPLLD